MEKIVIKAGIIGSGFAAKFHYDALQRVFNTQVEVVGAYSPNNEHLVAFTQPRDLHSFDELEEVIKEADVIHVCTPPVTHELVVIAALQQNKLVLISFSEHEKLYTYEMLYTKGYRK